MSKKRTVVHETDQNNTTNDTIVPPTESPYQALLRRKAELIKQKEDKAKAKK